MKCVHDKKVQKKEECETCRTCINGENWSGCRKWYVIKCPAMGLSLVRRPVNEVSDC